MDLIYTDSNRIEQGIVKEVVCDFAFGTDENDFEITTTKENFVIEVGGYVYFDDTEYGGRVDGVETASNNAELKYSGRTWHGIFNSYIVEGIHTDNIVPYNDEFYICHGKVSDVINDLVSFFNLTDIFVADDFDVEIDTTVARRLGAYDFLLDMLKQNEMKANFTHTEGKCHIITSYAIDYTDDQYFDDDKMNLSVKNSRKFTNHFVLHTYDEEEGQHYICHLFTDEYGIVQPYFIPDKDNATPLRDGEYIDDLSQRVISGQDEVVELLEGTSSVTNYVPVVLGVNTVDEHGEPEGWKSKDYCYDKYYYQEPDEETGELKWVQNKRELEFERITQQPQDWQLHWSDYYKKVDDTYQRLGEDDCPSHTDDYLIRSWADYINYRKYSYTNWKNIYKECYTKYWGGDTDVFVQVQGIPIYSYAKHTKKPDDWDDNKGNYYVKAKIYEYTIGFYSKKKGKGKKFNEVKTQDLKAFNKQYHSKLKKKKGSYTNYAHSNTSVKVDKITCLANGYITVSDYCKIVGLDVEKFMWKQKQTYTQYQSGENPPPFEDSKYYFLVKKLDGVPVFSQFEVYGEADLVKPPFAEDKYYYQAKDHFAGLVESANKKLTEELQALESLEGTLEEDAGEFDIGDIFGGKENVTGITGKSFVNKKIVKIDAFKVEIQYDIG